MTRLPVTKARKTLSEVVSHVAFGGERVVLSRNGKDVAAIVSMDALKLLEAEEDRLDVAEMQRAKREAAARDERAVPYEEARRTLALDRPPAAARRKVGKRR